MDPKLIEMLNELDGALHRQLDQFAGWLDMQEQDDQPTDCAEFRVAEDLFAGLRALHAQAVLSLGLLQAKAQAMYGPSMN